MSAPLTPEQILNAADLSKEEKIARLRQMVYDQAEREVATAEGMTPHAAEPPRAGLSAREALHRLDPDQVSTSTKHGDV
jgi:hypothetical protein